MKTAPTTLALWMMWIVFAAAPARGDELSDALDALRDVGPRGEGNEAAAAAWPQAAGMSAARLPDLLAALDGANPLAANWVRTAIDAVCERTVRSGGTLPREVLERFVLETSRDPKARRLAYEWLLEVEPTADSRIVPRLLDDPSVELRRDAVAELIEKGEAAVDAKKNDEALKLFERAFDAARDRDQVDLLLKNLRVLGVEADLVGHDGLIVEWSVIGPFDNTDEAGFDRVYPPEKGFDPGAQYTGKHGSVSWVEYRTESPDGKVDLYEALSGTLKRISEKMQEREVVAYASAEFCSPREQQAEIRACTMNAIKVWLNGEVVGEHNIYHAGSQFDQYRADVALEKGANRILVKLCQNAQTQSWTETFAFQLRVCDATGGGVRNDE